MEHPCLCINPHTISTMIFNDTNLFQERVHVYLCIRTYGTSMQTHAHVFTKWISDTILIEDAMLQLCLDATGAFVEDVGNTDVASSSLPCCKSHK